MRALLVDLRRYGNLCRTTALLDLGHSRSALGRARAAGVISSPRRGWTATVEAPVAALRAVTLGGRLGGAAALGSLGVWAGHDPPLVIALIPGTSRLPSVGERETRIWAPDHFPASDDRMFRVSVRDAILQHARVVDRAELIATLDSALHHGLLSRFELLELLERIPERVRPREAELNAASMAGSESLIRVELRSVGYHVTIQASIRHVGDVDLLVDDWSIVECDSRQFHDSASQQGIDRRRDGEAALARHGSARFTYAQVMFDRKWCLEVIGAGLARGRP